jgi:DNA replication protein DnaC
MSETVLALTHALSMPHARRNLDDFLETALIQKWSPTQVLEAFLTTEADGRAAIGLKRRLGILGIPENKTFDTFDTTQSSIPAPTINFLEALTWIKNKENLVIAGPSGTGKTHLIQALAHKCVTQGGKAKWMTMTNISEMVTSYQIDNTLSKQVKRLVNTDLLIIDDIGLLPVTDAGAQGLYRIIEAAYEKTSIALSSNIHPAKFDQLMPKTIATAAVDRLLHHAHMITTSGDSIRMSQARNGKGVKTK